MMQPFGQQMYQNDNSQVYQTIKQCIDSYCNRLVLNGQVTQFMSSSVVSQLYQYIPQIINQLASMYGNTVHTNNIEQMIAEYVNRIIGSGNMMQQQQMNNQGMGYQSPVVPFSGFQPQQTLNSAFNQKPTIQPVSPITSYLRPNTPNISSPPVDTTSALSQQRRLVVSASTPRHYNYVSDPNATSLSVSSEFGRIVEVLSRLKITDDGGNEYNYSRASAVIPEPTIQQVHDNFISTNPKLCAGKYILDIDFACVDVVEMRGISRGIVDMTPLISEDVDRLPVDTTLRMVVDSIRDRDHSIVDRLQKLIVTKFNNYLEMFCRITSDINTAIRVDNLDDICTLGSMRSKDYGDLTFHRSYASTILKCFDHALNDVVTNETPLGYHNMEDIFPHVRTSPKFVIREQGMCDRLKNNQDPAPLIKAADMKYRVFRIDSDMVISNFIPDELEEDLTGNVLQIKTYSNVFDSLVSEVWKGRPKVIIMHEGDKTLVVKTGMTMDGDYFMYKSDLDMSKCI